MLSSVAVVAAVEDLPTVRGSPDQIEGNAAGLLKTEDPGRPDDADLPLDGRRVDLEEGMRNLDFLELSIRIDIAHFLRKHLEQVEVVNKAALGDQTQGSRHDQVWRHYTPHVY